MSHRLRLRRVGQTYDVHADAVEVGGDPVAPVTGLTSAPRCLYTFAAWVYFGGMRETAVLVIAILAALVGMGVGRLFLPKRNVPVPVPAVPEEIVAAVPETVARTAPITKLVPETAPPDPVDADSTPEAIHAWRRGDKDALAQRVDSLAASEAEHLCFLLQLVPRDEVFDKINFKGRLKRRIADLRMDAEIDEVESALNDLGRR